MESSSMGMGRGGGEEKGVVVPLLEPSPARGGGGGASSVQTFVNIVVSIVGTGILGLPYAFRMAGWLAGALAVIFVGISTRYCMLLLVECRESVKKAAAAAEAEEEVLGSYGDLGAKAFGRTGGILTDLLVFIAQCGGSVAYLVFIGQNLHSVFSSSSSISISSLVFLLVPVEIVLSWIRSLSALAPFSALADAFMVLAMAIVVKDEIHLMRGKRREAVSREAGGVPFALGVAVYCFEGFSMTLPLQASMRESERQRFPCLLSLAFLGILILYVSFGLSGFLAYGDQTHDIVTLNLPNDWSAIAVKMGLCIGLTLTFPIMMHPVHQILEGRIKATTSGRLKEMFFEPEEQGSESESERVKARARVGLYIIRSISVVSMALVASFVPGFGVILSVVGSTFCALLSFVLPASFHLILMSSRLKLWQRALDLIFLLFGLLFACYGTYNALYSLVSSPSLP